MKRPICWILPYPKDASPLPGLECTSVRVSQRRPSNDAANLSRKDGKDEFLSLEDALSTVNSVPQLRHAIREEMVLICISKSEVQAIARQIAKKEAESSQQMMMTLFKTSPLSREHYKMVGEQLMPRFEQQNTRILNYWDESELDRFAKKMVPILQEGVPAAKAAIGSGPEPQAPFVPNIVRDLLPDDEREDGRRYRRWEREIVSDCGEGYGMCDE